MLRIGMPQGGQPPAPMPAGPAGAAPQLPPNMEDQSQTQKPSPNMVSDHESDRTSQQIAGYMGPDQGPFECEHCIHWVDPDSCTLVAGKLDPHGCCNLFQKDPNKPSENDGDADDAEQEPNPGNNQGVDV